MTDKWCGHCKEECDSHVIDEGIGHYEFWGQRGVHTDLCHISDCCEAEVYDDPECTTESDMPEKEYNP